MKQWIAGALLALTAGCGDEPEPVPVVPALVLEANGSASCVGDPGLYGAAVEAYRMSPEGVVIEWGFVGAVGADALAVRWTDTSSLAPEGFDTLRLVLPGLTSKPPGLLLQESDGLLFRDTLPPGQLRPGTTWRAVVLDEVRIGGTVRGCLAADVVAPDGTMVDLVAVWSGTVTAK